MKLLGATLIVLSCGMVGATLAENLRKRVATLNALYCLLNDYSISIQYTASTVWQLLENSYSNPQFGGLHFLKAFHDGLDYDTPFEELWNASIGKDSSLKPPEQGILYSVGNSLGKVGCDECISNLHLAMDRLKLLHSQAIEDYAKKGNLFRWLGILVGIGVAIVLA